MTLPQMKYDRGGRFDIKEQVRSGEIALGGGHFAVKRQPIARCVSAVLSRRVARVVCRDRIFFPEPRGIDEILEKQHVLFRARYRQPRLGEQQAGIVHAALAVVPRHVVERLGALRALVVGRDRLAQKSPFVLQVPQAARLHHPGVPRLLDPAAHPRPLGVGHRGLGGPSGVAVGLRQVEPIAVVLRLLLESGRQQPDVAFELVAPVRAAGVILVPDPLQLPAIAGQIDIFVGHALVARAGVAPDQAGVPITETTRRALQQPITRGGEAGAKTGILDHQLHVRIGEQEVIILQRRGIGMVERGVACLLEIVERETVQLSRQIALGKKCDDKILGAIGRAGITDHPATDVLGDRAKTALEVRHLVLDDHIEAEPLAVGHRRAITMQRTGIAGQMRLIVGPRKGASNGAALFAQQVVGAQLAIGLFVIGNKVL